MTTDTHRSQYRLPWPLFELLNEASKSNGRSVNAEIVARLEASFAEEAGLPGKLERILQEVLAIKEQMKEQR